MTLTLRKRFADGRYWVSYSKFLGYDRGPNGEMVINEEQAKVVRRIYALFLQGYTYTGICREMEGSGIEPPGGGKCWSTTYIRHVLTNEKYAGNALTQKTYIEDFLTHKCVPNNEGLLPQYWVEGGHEAIIDPMIFDMAQDELQRRGQEVKGRDRIPIFGARFRCADCGRWYGRKVVHCKSQYEQFVWYCNGKNKNQCSTPTLTEPVLRGASLAAMNSVLEMKDEVLANLKESLTSLADNEEYESRISALADSQERRRTDMQRLLRSTNGTGASVDEARERYEQMDREYNETDAEISRLSEELTQRKRQHSRIYRYIESLKRQEPLEDFSEAAFQALIDYATVYEDYRIVFTFKDGHEVTVTV